MSGQRFVLSAKDYVNKALSIKKRDLSFDEAVRIQDELAAKGYDEIRIRRQRTDTMRNPTPYDTSEGKLYLDVKEDDGGWKWTLTEKGLFGGEAYGDEGFKSEDEAEQAGIKFIKTRLNPKKVGRAAQKRISKKIAKITREEKHRPKNKRRSAKQVQAIAYSMERRHKLHNPTYAGSSNMMIWYVIGGGIIAYLSYQWWQSRQASTQAAVTAVTPAQAVTMTPAAPSMSVAGFGCADYGNQVMG